MSGGRETKRNYATDIRLLLTFLSSRGVGWRSATEQDLGDQQADGVRYGLSAAGRRDFALLFGDPWFLVKTLLGHADVDRAGTSRGSTSRPGQRRAAAARQ